MSEPVLWVCSASAAPWTPCRPTPKTGSQQDVKCELRRACLAAGLEVRTPHDLRHAYATILLMAGVSPAYVQKQLGHSSDLDDRGY